MFVDILYLKSASFFSDGESVPHDTRPLLKECAPICYNIASLLPDVILYYVVELYYCATIIPPDFRVQIVSEFFDRSACEGMILCTSERADVSWWIFPDIP